MVSMALRGLTIFTCSIRSRTLLYTHDIECQYLTGCGVSCTDLSRWYWDVALGTLLMLTPQVSHTHACVDDVKTTRNGVLRGRCFGRLVKLPAN